MFGLNLPNFKQPSTQRHSFSRVPVAQTPRSNFNRSHCYKTTFNSGLVVPFFVDEVLPGDTFNLDVTAVARLSTPLYPLMDNLYMDFHFFFVPNRLVWDNFQKFMGEQVNPDDSIDYLVPTVTRSDPDEFDFSSVYDYFGVPCGVTDLTINNLVGRGYNRIWNDWYRDENLQDSVVVDTGDGPDDYDDYYDVLPRGKRHDYFTSALPWPQKGDAVDLPLGTTADIFTDAGDDNAVSVYSTVASGWHGMDTSGVAGDNLSLDISEGSVSESYKLYADLSTATAATINSLRLAFATQAFFEVCARCGTRYTEIIKGHFGVDSPDARLQRSEYLGGATRPVVIAPIPQTSETSSTPQGNLAAVGHVNARGVGFTKSFVEHGHVFGMVSVRADLTYQQGLHKMWSRQTRDDFYWPVFAHIGEQAVLNKEIYAQGTSADDDVFGYQPYGEEYRYALSKVTNALSSNYATSLDAWHLAQDFSSLPVLGSNFIVEDPPVSRVVAVPSEPEFIFDAYLKLICTRPMPTFSVPGFGVHL
jgi:hypothetical protein